MTWYQNIFSLIKEISTIVYEALTREQNWQKVISFLRIFLSPYLMAALTSDKGSEIIKITGSLVRQCPALNVAEEDLNFLTQHYQEISELVQILKRHNLEEHLPPQFITDILSLSQFDISAMQIYSDNLRLLTEIKPHVITQLPQFIRFVKISFLRADDQNAHQAIRSEHFQHLLRKFISCGSAEVMYRISEIMCLWYDQQGSRDICSYEVLSLVLSKSYSSFALLKFSEAITNPAFMTKKNALLLLHKQSDSIFGKESLFSYKQAIDIDSVLKIIKQLIDLGKPDYLINTVLEEILTPDKNDEYSCSKKPACLLLIIILIKNRKAKDMLTDARIRKIAQCDIRQLDKIRERIQEYPAFWGDETLMETVFDSPYQSFEDRLHHCCEVQKDFSCESVTELKELVSLYGSEPQVYAGLMRLKASELLSIANLWRTLKNHHITELFSAKLLTLSIDKANTVDLVTQALSSIKPDGFRSRDFQQKLLIKMLTRSEYLHDIVVFLDFTYKFNPDLSSVGLLSRLTYQQLNYHYAHGIMTILESKNFKHLLTSSLFERLLNSPREPHYPQITLLSLLWHEQWVGENSDDLLLKILSFNTKEAQDFYKLCHFIAQSPQIEGCNPEALVSWASNSKRVERMIDFFNSAYCSAEYMTKHQIQQLIEQPSIADDVREIFSLLTFVRGKTAPTPELLDILLSLEKQQPEILGAISLMSDCYRRLGWLKQGIEEILKPDLLLPLHAAIIDQIIRDVDTTLANITNINGESVQKIVLRYSGNDRYSCVTEEVYQQICALNERSAHRVLDALILINNNNFTRYINVTLITRLLQSSHYLTLITEIYQLGSDQLQVFFKEDLWAVVAVKPHFYTVIQSLNELVKRQAFVSATELRDILQSNDPTTLGVLSQHLLEERVPEMVLERHCRGKYQISELLKLMQTYRRNNADLRGGVGCLINNVKVLVGLLCKQPEALSVSNDTASRYLAGCVNQPVRGFSEICAYAQIAATQSLPQKLSTARYLYALALIQSFLRQRSDLNPIFEAEAANYLLQQAYKSWASFSGLDKIWIGIPENILNVEGICGWADSNQQDFQREIYDKVNSATIPTLCHFLLNYSDVLGWAPLLFPEEAQALKKTYQCRVEQLTIELEYQMLDSEEKGEKISFESYVSDSVIPPKMRHLLLSEHQSFAGKDMVQLKRQYQTLRNEYSNAVIQLATEKTEGFCLLKKTNSII